MKKNITPLPWKSEVIGASYSGPNGVNICEISSDRFSIAEAVEADAAFIVKACNSHDALVAALAFYANAQNWDEFKSDERDAAFDRNTGSTLGDDCGKTARAILAKLEAK